MAKVIDFNTGTKDKGYAFYCAGCKTHHYVTDKWEFNGDYDKPTFSPSLLCKGSHPVCHSFIKAGKIEYLSDCEHEFAGQTLDMEDIEI